VGGEQRGEEQLGEAVIVVIFGRVVIETNQIREP